MGRSDIEKEIEQYILENKEMHYRLAYSYVKNKEDALDIVQESICKAISSVGSLKDPTSIKTWFYKIIVNTSIDFLRKRKRLIIGDEEFLATFDSGLLDNYEDIDLKKALEELPDNYRSIIILRYFEDFKIKEVAEILDENINTIKGRLYKALEKLRIRMNDYYYEED
ncbi:RNA polymerase sigma-70 factor (ECF subfamily) [Desulfitispora alkaliphila]|uniref:sigma-70 family RNA polymerase sigma factor n=1 Tax=Desulfitispora alkaliphila TaxID=622674 RepID=UPI003D19AC13